MFITSNWFWMLMGMLTILVGVGFKYLAADRGWTLSWWKWLLSIIWWVIFSLTFYTSGILVGENESGAGMWVLLSGLFVSLILGVILWRVLAHGSEDNEEPETAEAAVAEA